jgi:hypothetical protein
MITLGEILSIDQLGNMCKVKLPTLEGAGNVTTIELHATMMLPPGIDSGYEVGDVVFVAFVDNTLGRPVVLGQLYRGPGKGTKVDNIGNISDKSLGRATTMACTNLDVQTDATIAGTSIAALIQRVDALDNKVKSLDDQLNPPSLLDKIVDAILPD